MGRKSFSKSTSVNVFEGMIGGVAAMASIGFACLTLFVLGYYFIVAYNKPGTKWFNEIQPMQYVGIILCLIACVPLCIFLLNADSFSKMLK